MSLLRGRVQDAAPDERYFVEADLSGVKEILAREIDAGVKEVLKDLVLQHSLEADESFAVVSSMYVEVFTHFKLRDLLEELRDSDMYGRARHLAAIRTIRDQLDDIERSVAERVGGPD